jgi:hypothetical protein
MSIGYWWKDTDWGKLKYLDKNLSEHHCSPQIKHGLSEVLTQVPKLRPASNHLGHGTAYRLKFGSES